jgi:hypothetical protein
VKPPRTNIGRGLNDAKGEGAAMPDGRVLGGGGIWGGIWGGICETLGGPGGSDERFGGGGVCLPVHHVYCVCLSAREGLLSILNKELQ